MDTSRSFAVHPDIVFRRIGDEVVLVNLQTDRMFALNRTGADFLEHLAAGLTLNEARTRLLAAYDVDAATVEREMAEMLQQFLREGFLVDDPSN